MPNADSAVLNEIDVHYLDYANLKLICSSSCGLCNQKTYLR